MLRVEVRRRRRALGLVGMAVALGLLAQPFSALASGDAAAAGKHLGIPDAVWKTANLVLFFGLIVYLAAKPVGELLRKRKETIVARHEEAARKREEAARRDEEICERIAALEAEVDRFAARAREEGEREKDDLESRAVDEAAKIVVQARDEVGREVEAARKRLAAYAGSLAVEIATKRIDAAFDDEGRARFLDRAIDEVGKSSPDGSGGTRS